MIAWSESLIARELAVGLFAKKLVVVDNCNWTGHECDLLCVTTDLRIVDVEIKISRADFKADAKKDKWWNRQFHGYAPRKEVFNDAGRLIRIEQPALYNVQPRPHPPKVWKHYYALPEEIWNESLFEFMPSPASGVVLLAERKSGYITHRVIRRATPCRDASRIAPAQALDIARLASLRRWEALQRLRAAQSDVEFWKAKQREAEAL